MLRKKRLRSSILMLCTASLFALPRSYAQSGSSSWECLPDETVAALHIPNGSGLAEALRETKFGTVMFSDKRRAAVVEALEADDSGKWSEFHGQLQEYGLTTDDLLSLFRGDSGYAVAISEQVDDQPLFVGLGWLEPGEELASKLYDVVARLIDEQDDEQSIGREDLTLADRPVMQLQLPTVKIVYEDDFDVGDDYSDLPAEAKREAWNKAYQQWEESAVETTVYRTALVCVLGDRLLVAHTYQAIDEDAATTTAEQVGAIFGRWLNSHTAGSDGFVSRLADEPSAARVMALEGLPVFELLGDLAPLVQLLRASAPSDKRAEQVVRLVGLDNVGPFAARSTVEGTQWRSQVSVAIPAPRQGLMRLLDQELLSVEPPQWVPASAVRYYQLSFDLGAAYEIIKEEVTREYEDQAAVGFATAETQVQNFLQASLPELLSSLGNRHVIMSFGLETRSNEADDDEEGNQPSERMVFVWQVEGEALWAKVLKAITPFAGMAEGIESAEEQGFSGWRMKSDTVEGGLFLGKGYLVLGYGSGVTETVLASLNNPPTGSNALRGSEVFATAGEMIDLEPSLAVEITDGNRYLNMLYGWLEQQLGQLKSMLDRANDSDEDDQSMFALFRAAMPSQDEIEGMMGVIVSRWEVNDDGLFGNSSQEMPRP